MRLVRMRKMRLGGLSVAMACLASVSMTAQSPYGWRGPERDGVYFENGLLKEYFRKDLSYYGKPWSWVRDIPAP